MCNRPDSRIVSVLDSRLHVYNGFLLICNILSAAVQKAHPIARALFASGSSLGNARVSAESQIPGEHIFIACG